MNQKEVVETLLDQAKIEPGFTELGNHEYLFDWQALCAFYFFFLICKTYMSWFILHYSLLMQLLEFTRIWVYSSLQNAEIAGLKINSLIIFF
jgi:hypothetical protein